MTNSPKLSDILEQYCRKVNGRVLDRTAQQQAEAAIKALYLSKLPKKKKITMHNNPGYEKAIMAGRENIHDDWLDGYNQAIKELRRLLMSEL